MNAMGLGIATWAEWVRSVHDWSGTVSTVKTVSNTRAFQRQRRIRRQAKAKGVNLGSLISFEPESTVPVP